MRALTVLTFLLILCIPRTEAQQRVPAATGCTIGVDTAVTSFRSDVLKDSLLQAQIDAHEQVHRAQIREAMKTGQDCLNAYWDLTRTPEANLQYEVPAYRAQAAWLSDHYPAGFDESRFYEQFARRLYFAYRSRLSYTYIYVALTSGTVPDTPKEYSGP